MFFTWNKQNIKWFLDASSYVGFHKTLAQRIIPYLEPGGTLLDAGCGLGRLDLELAPYVSELTAVDINESVINILRRDAQTLGLHNLRTYIRDTKTLTGVFDVLLLSFFGQSNMLDFQKLHCRRIIRIVNAENKSGLYPKHHRRNLKDTVPLVKEELSAGGVNFKLELEVIEFGQPLKTWHDAEAFVLKNAPEADKKEINDFLNENIERTGRDDFPFYLPNQKELGIFIIDKEG